MSPKKEKRPRIRAAVAVLNQGQILLVQHTKADRSYWLLPGGGLDWGESLHQAAQREVSEETGVKVSAGELLFVSETLAPDGAKHVVHLVFEASYQGGEPRVPAEARITDVRWFDLDKVSELILHPPMQSALAQLLSKKRESVFLGNLWVD
jgi:ADP-ribose pyrophosphatase YjhB (NUDIX family)